MLRVGLSIPMTTPISDPGAKNMLLLRVIPPVNPPKKHLQTWLTILLFILLNVLPPKTCSSLFSSLLEKTAQLPGRMFRSRLSRRLISLTVPPIILFRSPRGPFLTLASFRLGTPVGKPIKQPHRVLPGRNSVSPLVKLSRLIGSIWLLCTGWLPRTLRLISPKWSHVHCRKTSFSIGT